MKKIQGVLGLSEAKTSGSGSGSGFEPQKIRKGTKIDELKLFFKVVINEERMSDSDSRSE